MAPRKGRPPLDWLTTSDLARLDPGTPIAVETHGRHNPRTIGRVREVTDRTIELATATGPVTIPLLQLKRARQVPSLYEPGDPVVMRGTPAHEWRGGVVRTVGTDVLVEQIDGSFAWYGEDRLEPADARNPDPPPLPRGPVPAAQP